MLQIETEKRLRAMIRKAKSDGLSHAYAGWLGSSDEDDIARYAYIVGKRKLKLYLAGVGNGKSPSGRSTKSTGILVAEMSGESRDIYTYFAEELEKAQEQYKVVKYKDHWGHNHKWVAISDQT